MILKDLIELVSKERRRQERVKTAQKFAVGMGILTAGVATGIIFAPKSGKATRADLKNIAANILENIKDTVQMKAETVKDCAANAAQEAGNGIKDVKGKTEGVKKHLKDGHHERQDS